MVQKPHEGYYVKYISLLLILLFGGCSYKTSELFEDLFAENKVIKAEGQYKHTISKDPRTPILSEPTQNKKIIINNKPNTFRGKIASVHFDRDFNLYMYTFIDNLTHKPIIFYYDKNIQQKKYSGDYRIVVNGNYLINYKQVNEYTTRKNQNTAVKRPYIKRTKYKKRRRSSIKVPVEEKINPL